MVITESFHNQGEEICHGTAVLLGEPFEEGVEVASWTPPGLQLRPRPALMPASAAKPAGGWLHVRLVRI